MGEALTRFLAAAALENRGRGRMGRRYSAALRAQTVRYWAQREPEGDGFPEVAAALGVAGGLGVGWRCMRTGRRRTCGRVSTASAP